MKIKQVQPLTEQKLYIIAEDGQTGIFDLTAYLQYEAFAELQHPEAFNKVINGGYFIEWECGADLSADTIEAHWQVNSPNQNFQHENQNERLTKIANRG